ncbi:MAG TPA: hypothetical protein H9742_09975 [Candidatus Acetatifactor stercoripullorum]|uniref:Uncharacterized protein n=1 Tax=Candidatus Acetatifactor stercoripullorum TaxID=2838414 RepID=A0A9D1UCV8_9FIRM|nr:hypothetical protein [uncultured Acetatifactor sp.]HIW81825.1 hypothetical protein [Candidatus Acetatifactor stercoripullorum]
MDNLPNGGKVVIVDDCFHEILPLINILNRNAIPIIYFTGKASELPQKPMEGIRVFFLDLRFSTNTDAKTIISNACNILNTVLGKNNGPYLLIIWSSTGKEYRDELEKALEEKIYRPEFILYLSKADYFQTKDSAAYSLVDDIEKILTDSEVENAEGIMKKITARVIADEDESEKIFIPSSMDKLQQELYDGLKNAGLLSLFILWENTVRNSAHKAVNEIFSQIPKSIPTEKKLPAMAYYLAKNRLEKQFETVEEKDRLRAALMEMNELYAYFYSEDVVKLPVDGFLPINIQKNTELVPSQAKFNSWKMISPIYKKDAPGNIYEDKSRLFQFFHLIKDYNNEEKYEEAARKLRDDERILYIGVNVNGECETAHNKYPVIRVTPGILIPCDVYKEYESGGMLKAINKAGDYIFHEFDSVEYEGKEYSLLFNLNQSTFLCKEELEDIQVYFTLHRKYYLKLRQALAADFAKQGVDLYGG